jgi:hypothetical protein
MARPEFDVSPLHVAFLVTVALLTMDLHPVDGSRAVRARSALISALSGLLLRTDHGPRRDRSGAGRREQVRIPHPRQARVFNPTNIAIVVPILLTDRVWVSPGQGSTAIFAFGIASAGFLVVQRAARADVTLAFLVFMAAIQFGRAAWLGQPWAVPLHRMENGALLLFAFFMISDPKTTPDSRLGRIVFAFLVALGAGFVSFGLYRTNGLLWSLAVCSLVVPLIDRLLPGTRYTWGGARPHRESSRKGSVMLQPLVRRLGAAAFQSRVLWMLVGIGLVMAIAPLPAAAFCGFYVARADAQLFNEASQVVLARDGDRT